MKRYEKHKPSGIEWMGEIPEHWAKTRISAGTYLLIKKQFYHLYRPRSQKSGQNFRHITKTIQKVNSSSSESYQLYSVS